VFIVGRSGNAGAFFAVVTASALILPELRVAAATGPVDAYRLGRPGLRENASGNQHRHPRQRGREQAQ